MSQPEQRRPQRQADATGELLAPRKRRRRHSSSSSSSASPSQHHKSGKHRYRRWVVALAVTGGTALVILLAGLALWVWHKPLPPPPMPVASLTEMLANKPDADWRWLRLKSNTAVLVLEFPTLIEQGATMNRMAAFLEKRSGSRDRLLDDHEMAALLKSNGENAATFYFGHDYGLDRVAKFYTQAEEQKLVLDPQELRLRESLVHWAILRRDDDGSYHAIGDRALISFTAVQPDDPATTQDETVDERRRDSVLRHEVSHGEFFTEDSYRQQCWEFWRKTLSESERQMFRKYLSSIDYDPANEELMVNETQALLMHTPDTRAFGAGDLGISDEALDKLRRRFNATK